MQLAPQLLLVVPGLAHIYEPNWAANLRVPALQKILARARRIHLAERSLEAWLCDMFELNTNSTCPIAAFSFLGDGGEPGKDYWLCADPIHLRIYRDQLILLDNEALTLDWREAEQFIATLNAHFAIEGLRFYAPTPHRWYVKLPRAVELTTHPLHEVTGRNISHYLPTGKDQSHWRRIFNEVQMLFFEHAVNQERETRGELPVNSIWFWGEGTLTAPKSLFASLFSNNAFIKGVALAAGVPLQETPETMMNCLSQLHGQGHHLLTLENLASPARHGDLAAWRAALLAMEEQWFQPLVSALQQKRLQTVSLHAFADSQHDEFNLWRGDLWKFWRRPV